MAKPKKIKSVAQINVPQTKEAAAADIRLIGDIQRNITRMQTQMNDLIAETTEEFQVKINPKILELQNLQKGVQAYCESNREMLTDGNKVKSANLITGIILWRQRPPSVSITGEESVIQALIRLKLSRFVRTKAGVNKEAILNDIEAVKGVAGIKINSGIEDFVIEPFEQEVQS